MQIALTKKLADAMGINPPPAQEVENPLFSWTANWTNVWDNRKAEDMLVLVNNATRFAVALYQVKRKDLKNVAEMMRASISNTLLATGLNPELVEEYMRLAGHVEFARNHNRQTAAWVTKAGLECALHVGREYDGIAKMFSDTIGASTNHYYVNGPVHNEVYSPDQAMIKALTELTGKQPYKYRAFELLVTLDLEIYHQVIRRIIVPANLEFARLHKVLQSAFGWENYHLYDFTFFGINKYDPVARMVPFEDDLEFDEDAILMKDHILSDFLPEHQHIRYTYDLGDNWEHEIQLVRVIEDYDQESPYLLEAKGQTPPEDVGGVGGFIDFREIMLNPGHSEYKAMREWAKYWTVELHEWQSRPRVIRV